MSKLACNLACKMANGKTISKRVLLSFVSEPETAVFIARV